MEAYELLQKLPYMLMILLGVGFLIQVYLGGLLELDQQVDDAQREDIRLMTAMENMLTVETTSDQLAATDTAYDFEDRRAILPLEYFTGEKQEDDEIGYSTTSAGHCYIDGVSGVDGENYAFYIQPLEDPDEFAEDPRDTDCRSPPGQMLEYNAVHSPVLLIRKGHNRNPQLNARLFVYEVQP